MKPRRKFAFVSTLTQMYQGAATKRKTRRPWIKRRSQRTPSFRDQRRNRNITPAGSTTPTGPLANTPSAVLTPAAKNHRRLFEEKPFQKINSVVAVVRFRSASGLAKWADPQNATLV